MNKSWLLISFLGALLLAASCQNNNDDDDANTHDDAIADVFVKKRPVLVSDSVISCEYATVFYAYGNGLVGGEVEAPDGSKYSLQSYWKSGSIRYLPADTDYGTLFPDTGEYRFHLSFSDQQSRNLNDHLYNMEIDAISAATISHNPGYHGTSISWSLIHDVDEYIVRLCNYPVGHQEDIFAQEGFTILDNGIYFDSLYTSVPGWNYNLWPAYGDSCYIMVEAWKNEPGASDPRHNRQMLTDRGQLIVW